MLKKLSSLKNVLIFLCLLTIKTTLYGQTYAIAQNDNLKNYYNYLIRIKKDSTINFIYNRNQNESYAEYIGTIKKLNDTTFRISANMLIGQFPMKSFSPDTLYIQIDSSIGRQLDVIEISYSNGMRTKQFSSYESSGNPIAIIEIPINKKLYNSKAGTNYVNIAINRKNQVTDKWLTFRISYGSAASFTKDRKLEFDVSIKKGILTSITESPLRGNNLKLKLQNSK